VHPAIKLLGLGLGLELYAEFLAQYFAAGTILLKGRTAPALLEIMSH
jgi:hypothetical protein